MRQSLNSVSVGLEGKSRIRSLIISGEKGFFLCFTVTEFLSTLSTILDKKRSLAGSLEKFRPGMKPCNHFMLNKATETADLPWQFVFVSSRYCAMCKDLNGISIGKPNWLQKVKNFRRAKQYFSIVEGLRDVQTLLIKLIFNEDEQLCQNCWHRMTWQRRKGKKKRLDRAIQGH